MPKQFNHWNIVNRPQFSNDKTNFIINRYALGEFHA